MLSETLRKSGDLIFSWRSVLRSNNTLRTAPPPQNNPRAVSGQGTRRRTSKAWKSRCAFLTSQITTRETSKGSQGAILADSCPETVCLSCNLQPQDTPTKMDTSKTRIIMIWSATISSLENGTSYKTGLLGNLVSTNS